MGRQSTRIVIALLAAAWIAAAWVYLSGKRTIEKFHVADTRNLPTVTSGLQSDGERLARLYGCLDCHGDRLQGQLIFDHVLDGRRVAPNLTRTVEKLTIPEIEAIIRQGIRPNGTSVFGMPSSSFAVMTDEDLGAILSYIERQPEQVEDWGEQDFGLYSRYLMMRGLMPAQAEVSIHRPWRSFLLKDERRLGEYLATTACSQCHGLDLEGRPRVAPSLDRVYDYDRFEFVALMKEGSAPGAQDDEAAMNHVASERFSYFKEDEIQALYEFLKSRP